MKRVYDNEDIEKQRSHSMSFSEEQHAKSFAIFGNNTQSFVNLILPQIKLKGKENYKKQPYCMICFRGFTTTFRQHHCRVCANATCGDCSRSLINKQRACDLCVMRLSNIHEQKKKKEILDTYELLCAFMIYKKNCLIQQLQQLKQSNKEGNQQHLKQELEKQQEIINKLQSENQEIGKQKKQLDEELNTIRKNNSKLQTTIMEIQRQI